MAPILYHIELSPPVRAVLLTAKAIGVELELKDMNLIKGDHMDPEFVKKNPQHTVPTLDDNGFIIWDSHAINTYLVGKYAKNDSLYPKDLQKRAIIDQRLHFDSGILFPRMRNMFFPVIYLGEKTIPEEKKEAIREGYALSEKFLEGKKYFAGDEMTVADFSAISSLSSVCKLVPLEKEKYPNVFRWMETMKKLPYYQEANGKGSEDIFNFINEKLEKNN